MLAAPRPGRRQGKVAILVAVALIPVLGAVAISVDGGMLLSDRRGAQRAADAAALAAAVDLYTNYKSNYGKDPGGTAAKSAQTAAAANGFADDGTNTVVTVNIPPKTGAFAGKDGYVEVLLTYNQPRYFSAIWGSGKIQVAARAVARGMYKPAAPGILILDPKDNNTLNVTASGGVTVTNGGAIDVDSTSGSGLSITNIGNVTADAVNITGPSYAQSNTGTVIRQINYNQPPTPDPLATLPEPAQPSLPILPSSVLALLGSNYSTTNGVNYSGTATIDLYPGYYGGIKMSSGGTIILHPNADGSPGIYYIGSQGLSISNAGSMTGSNVMLYSAGTGAISLTGSGSLTLSPPTSGPYQGITLFQERTSSKQISITAQGNMNLTGTFYAAAAKVAITGQGNYNNQIGSQWVAWNLAVTGSGSFTVNYSDKGGPIRQIGLIE
jgi:Flp pilus assembly protein TadG